MTTDDIQLLYQAAAILEEYARTEIIPTKDINTVMAYGKLIRDLRLATETIKRELAS